MALELIRSTAVTLRFSPTEATKHRLVPTPDAAVVGEAAEPGDLILALGGDGTVLRALGLSLETGVPVFGFNFGRVGFLTTVEADQAESPSSLRPASWRSIASTMRCAAPRN